MLAANPLHVRGQLQRFLVLPLPDTGLHQLRQLQNLQQLRVPSQRQRVQPPGAVNTPGRVQKPLASGAKLRQLPVQPLDPFFGFGKLFENFPRTFRRPDEGLVIVDRQFLGLLDVLLALVLQPRLFLLQLVHLVRTELEHVVDDLRGGLIVEQFLGGIFCN